MEHILERNINLLPGVGSVRAKLLQKELDIHTFKDLLYFFPYKYVDRTKFFLIKELTSNVSYVQIKGKITGIRILGEKRKKRLVATFSDNTGKISLVWFRGIVWLKKKLKLNQAYLVFGKPTLFNQSTTIIHPEIEVLEETRLIKNLRLQAYYHTTEKMKQQFLNSKAMLKLQVNLAKIIDSKMAETLPSYFLQKFHLNSLKEALYQIHFPENSTQLKLAQYRLKFDELFFLQLNILQLKYRINHNYKGYVFEKIGKNFNTFYKNYLPFQLTGSQKKVIKEIRKDFKSGKQMNRLLQGDVGSGKTIVALFSMLIAIDNGFQVCLMAPTEILATQHYTNFLKYLSKLPLNVCLLKRTTSTKERNKIYATLESGDLHILIGTHALLEEKVKFNKLGLAIIDEQQRFGVAQRAKLWKKKSLLPHILVMTATPIPRTLAMTLYGDLDVSTIDEMPPDRKSVKTIHVFDNNKKRIFDFLIKKIAEGRQVYVVYPLIKESEKMDFKNVEQGFKELCQIFPTPKYKVSMIHGKLPTAQKEAEMQSFLEGKSQILVATTVIEIGLDIPNATIMVIESAERFGLSQLHQLRGRVGRGAKQSYCFLVSSYKLSQESTKRLRAMVSTNDGFEIAEIDLKHRGPGNIEGTQQSGIPFNLKIASLTKDDQLIKFTRNIVQDIIQEDPDLKLHKNELLRYQIKKQHSSKNNWSVIS